jgi:two-component system phosphate regulon response regulator PhoB
MRSKILSIEDDLTTQVLIEQSLKDYTIVTASDLKTAELELSRNIFDAILLDIELPDGDGLKFFTKLSHEQKFKQIPTLILSGHGDISNKLLAFSVGADDFITKPFDPLELNARLSSKIKKMQVDIDAKRTCKIGDLEIDFDRQKVFQKFKGREKDLFLTAIEIKILTMLSKRTEQVFSREQILNNVWGETVITDRTVDSHVAHLRTKIADSKVVIDTVKNFGYRVILKEHPENSGCSV